MSAVALAAAMLLALGCSKGGSGEAGVIAAWQRAGLEPSSFEPIEAPDLGAAKCRAGKVHGIDATLCEFSDAAAAKRAESASLARLKNATGLAISQGKLLLLLADRGRTDPSGKQINKIAKTFRDR